jgi:hypothetical protein
MASLSAIRDRLASLAAAADSNLTTYETVEPQIVVPALIFAPAPGAFLTEVTVDGAEDLQMIALVLVSKVADDAAQQALDTYASEGSSNLANAMDSGSTADWDYTVSQPARSYGEYVFGEGEQAQRYLGFEIPVTVGVS